MRDAAPFSRRAAVGAVVGFMAVLALASPAVGQIQIPPELEVDPSLPVADGFDVERAFLGSRPIFTPLRDPEFISLRQALRNGSVEDDTPLLVFEAGGRMLSMVTGQMSYHHVAQGEMAGEPVLELELAADRLGRESNGRRARSPVAYKNAGAQ